MTCCCFHELAFCGLLWWGFPLLVHVMGMTVPLTSCLLAVRVCIHCNVSSLTHRGHWKIDHEHAVAAVQSKLRLTQATDTLMSRFPQSPLRYVRRHPCALRIVTARLCPSKIATWQEKDCQQIATWQEKDCQLRLGSHLPR